MTAKNGAAPPKSSLHNLLNPENLDAAAMLLRRWPLVLSGVGVGLALGLLYLCIASTKYESSAQILVMKKDSNLPARGTETSTDRASEVTEDLMATHMQIVQSPAIIRNGLKKHGLEGLPSIQARLAWDEDEIEYIIDHLKVTRGGTGQARLANVLNVTFRHVSDEDCEHVLGAIVESYQQFLAEKFQDVSEQAVKLIAEAKDQIGKELQTVEAEYQKFREEAPLLWNGDSSSNTHRLAYERLQTSISELDLETATARTRLGIVEQAIAKRGTNLEEVDLLALIDDAHVARLTLLVQVKQGSSNSEEFQILVPGLTASTRTEYEGVLPLALKEKSLLADYGPDHPLVLDVREQIKHTESFVNKKQADMNLPGNRPRLDPSMLINGYVTLLKNDLDTIALRRSEMEQLSSKEEAAAKDLVFAELKGEALRKEVSRTQDLYDAVIERLREINLVGAYGKLITEVIEPVALGEKVWPKWHWVLLIGLVFGLMLGGGAAFGAERLDRTFHSEEELRRALALPVLTRLAKLKTIENDAAALSKDGLDPSLVAHHRPKSREAEAFRGVRTALFFGSRGRRQQILMCTSASPGDGKTLLNTNLAISIAQSGRKVLLIDADLRRPRVHHMFNVENTNGLAAVIRGEIDPPDAVQPTAVENLWCLPCGVSPSNPAELLSSLKFEECLNVFRNQYEFILIDCPPLLAVADPCIIAPLADAVIVTVRLMKNTRSQVLRSKELLENVQANVIGVFVNGVEEVAKGLAKYGYGRYGMGQYGYGSYAYGYDSHSNGAYYEDDETTAGANGKSNGHAEAPPVNGATNGHAEAADK